MDTLCLLSQTMGKALSTLAESDLKSKSKHFRILSRSVGLVAAQAGAGESPVIQAISTNYRQMFEALVHSPTSQLVLSSYQINPAVVPNDGLEPHAFSSGND